MRLFEEYLLRHKIIDVPLVHHCANGTLLLESTDPSQWESRWVLVSIRWIEDDHHPGQYLIEMKVPVHDGYAKGSFFARRRAIEKKWQEYEDYILEWTRILTGVRPIRGQREVTMSAWEMFTFMSDSWFIKQPAQLKQKLFQSLDKENSIATRYSNYQDVAIFLSTHHPAVMRAWKYEVLAHVQNRADWLANLIENKHEPTPQEEFLQEKVGIQESV